MMLLLGNNKSTTGLKIIQPHLACLKIIQPAITLP